MNWTQEKTQETLLQIQKKVAADAAFREKLKANPNSTIEEIAGIQLPAGFKINIVDANEADLTIALPKISTDELNDNDLEAVSGGKSATDVLCNIATGGVTQLMAVAGVVPDGSGGTADTSTEVVEDLASTLYNAATS